MSILGKRLKYLREKFNYSQKRVADSIGISNVQLSRYESGDRNPDPDLIAKFADFFDVTTDFLHGRTDEKNESYQEINTAFHDFDNLTEEEKEHLELQLQIFRELKKRKQEKNRNEEKENNSR
jgi:transcriptional regulator with XRE-family HTH domain